MTRERENCVRIKTNNQIGFIDAKEGDGVGLDCYLKNHRGTVQSGQSRTIVPDGFRLGVVVKRAGRLQVRQLTPRECLRLQGVNDRDINRLNFISDTVKYHLAGDSIVVNVLMAIFKEMIGKENYGLEITD